VTLYFKSSTQLEVFLGISATISRRILDPVTNTFSDGGSFSAPSSTNRPMDPFCADFERFYGFRDDLNGRNIFGFSQTTSPWTFKICQMNASRNAIVSELAVGVTGSTVNANQSEPASTYYTEDVGTVIGFLNQSNFVGALTLRPLRKTVPNLTAPSTGLNYYIKKKS
jgi:hypothetical protein